MDQNQRSRVSDLLHCFNCNSPGHLQSECREPKQTKEKLQWYMRHLKQTGQLQKETDSKVIY